MQDKDKTKAQLIHELTDLRMQNAELKRLDDERKGAEAMLHTCRAQFKTIFDNAAFGLALVQPDCGFLQANPFLCRMLGYTQEELSSKTFHDVTHPEDRARGAENVRQMLSGEIRFEWVEKRYVHKDGRILWGMVNSYLVRDSSGTPSHFIIWIQDVTLQKQATADLKNSEARYRAIVEDQTELISRFSPDYKLVFVNQAYCRYFGETAGELIGRDFRHHVPAEDRANLARYLSSLNMRDPVGVIEHQVIDVSGEVRWQQWTDRAIFDEDGRLFEFQAVGRDITKRKRGEAVLYESERRFREMLENVKQAAVMLDVHGDITFCNSFLLGLAGWKRDEVLGRNWFETFLPPEVRDEVVALFQRILTDVSFPPYYENVIVTRQGERRTIAWNNSTLRDADGSIIGATGIGQDITDRKRLEMQLRQTQKMEAIGTLAGGIAHDFNNILAAIIGYTEMVMAEVSEYSPLRLDLEQVLKAGRRARDLVKQILVFSRMESEKEKVPVRLSVVIGEALKWIRATLPTNIEIGEENETDPDEGVTLGDPTQLHQVLVNLCTNAASAMREHGGVLKTTLSPVAFGFDSGDRPPQLAPGTYFRVTVEDTGHGMDASTLERIFDPYFTTKGTGQGSGLGLAIAHGVVKRHGGAITVLSEPGKGTVFHVYLPRADKQASREVPEAAPMPGGNEQILFVDDEQVLVDLIRKALERVGYRVLATTDSVEALEAFRAQPDQFDLVVTDYTMPKMTGLDLAREVLRLRPDIPVILCTGYTEAITEHSARRAGIRELVLKPLNLREIAALIRRVLDENKPTADG